MKFSGVAGAVDPSISIALTHCGRLASVASARRLGRAASAKNETLLRLTPVRLGSHITRALRQACEGPAPRYGALGFLKASNRGSAPG
jgi:hypothetical protein